MEIYSALLVREQWIDGEHKKEDIIMRGIMQPNDQWLFEYIIPDEGKVLIEFSNIEPTSMLLRIFTNSYQAVIPLELNETTQGTYRLYDKELTFDFILHKFTRKGLAFYLEYDIVTKDSVISNNAWKIEVKSHDNGSAAER